jgi:hypothetical protein
MGSTQSISNAIKNKQWVQQVLSLPVPFLDTERTKGREHACPLPILHDHINCYVFFFLYLPILSCQLPIYHLFSSDGKMLFPFYFMPKFALTWQRTYYFSVAKLLFYSKTLARFSGEKFSNRHIWIRSFVGGHQPTYLMNPISRILFFFPHSFVI